MEVQPMTVIVNTDYGFPGDCGSTTGEVKKEKNLQQSPQQNSTECCINISFDKLC